ncbi:MAG: hypothetical protein KA198_06570 [Chitinophagaceae bacterium]|nr:hypothetical protein [Chitinophagaceae bacterium]
MKKLYVFVFLLNLYSATQAQIEENLKELELTSNPAYVLLGVQPTDIQRPSTPRDFTSGIQSAMVNGVLQPNFAMEFNPFNWIKKPQVNTHSFIANDYFSKKAWPAIKKNFAFSLATSPTDTMVFGSFDQGTGLGYGFRVTIFPGKVNQATTADFTSWADAESKEVFLSVLEAFINKEDHVFSYDDVTRAFDLATSRLIKNDNISSDLKGSIQESLVVYKATFSNLLTKEKVADKIESEKELMSKQKMLALNQINQRVIPFARDGFILEVAYSGVSIFQQNQWDRMANAKNAVWLTPSYRIDLGKKSDPTLIQSLDIMALGRFIQNDKRVDVGNYFDAGGKLQFNHNDWNISLEGISRWASKIPIGYKSNWTYSWMTNLMYTIKENVTLRFTFGSKFDGNTKTYTDPKQMVAIGGLNFGLLK